MNNFLWVCWFLDKNIFNFVPPVWKLHNPYCHKLHTTVSVIFSIFINKFPQKCQYSTLMDRSDPLITVTVTYLLQDNTYLFDANSTTKFAFSIVYTDQSREHWSYFTVRGEIEKSTFIHFYQEITTTKKEFSCENVLWQSNLCQVLVGKKCSFFIVGI